VSNTIRKTRKRPRVRSCNFRTLGWLIRREAAWRIRQGFRPEPWDREVRFALMRESWQFCHRRVAAVLHYNEARRYYP